uniref:Predicted protein n=1 Tax=Hordeum vulgare subsp. vulgare TaxID=112509 RepID=F2DX52_HORVV|nr:predicted protein [Hordeum vulgare subsp. vulgare]
MQNYLKREKTHEEQSNVGNGRLSLCGIPKELLQVICSWLSARDLCRLELADIYLRQILSDETFQSPIWKQIYFYTFLTSNSTYIALMISKFRNFNNYTKWRQRYKLRTLLEVAEPTPDMFYDNYYIFDLLCFSVSPLKACLPLKQKDRLFYLSTGITRKPEARIEMRISLWNFPFEQKFSIATLSHNGKNLLYYSLCDLNIADTKGDTLILNPDFILEWLTSEWGRDFLSQFQIKLTQYIENLVLYEFMRKKLEREKLKLQKRMKNKKEMEPLLNLASSEDSFLRALLVAAYYSNQDSVDMNAEWSLVREKYLDNDFIDKMFSNNHILSEDGEIAYSTQLKYFGADKVKEAFKTDKLAENIQKCWDFYIGLERLYLEHIHFENSVGRTDIPVLLENLRHKNKKIDVLLQIPAFDPA